MAAERVLKRFSIALDIKKAISNREFEVVEDDNANTLHITLTDNGEAVDLADCRVLAVFSKSNGTSSQDSAAAGGGIELGGAEHNEIDIALFTTSFSPGIVECEIQVFSGVDLKTLATSAKFNFTCRRGILNADTIESANEYPLLVDLIDRVEDIESVEIGRVAAESARDASESARASAEGLRSAAEAARGSSESARLSAEAARASSEAARVSAESARATAESGRVGAESARVIASGEAVDRANAAAEACENIAAGAAHAATHASDGSDPVSPASIGAAPLAHDHDALYEGKRLQFTDTGVSTSAFVSDETYSAYPYRAAVELEGVTAAMLPEVVLSAAEASSGEYAPVAQCYAGGVYVYAQAQPQSAITIPTIVCWKAVS